MKSSLVPVFCGLILTAITAAGISHWWSVQEIIAASQSSAVALTPPAAPEVKPAQPAEPKPAPLPRPPATQAAAAPAPNEEFYRTLLEEFKKLKNENRDLRDQMAETNRDLMKLEFRVDTHSESFRPLPVSEDRADTVLDTGVLPPLDEALDLPVQ